jgi:predicted AAA+ superfamily ATPase
MKIPRFIENTLLNKIQIGKKIIILYGARQVGKTTLITDLLKKISGKKLIVNADEKKYIDIFSSRDFDKMKLLVAGYDVLFIDEAQRIPDIGINLKILHDQMPSLRIIATGSSSFELANKIKEPLTGRTWSFQLYPIAFKELSSLTNQFETDNKLNELLIYGSYPEVLLYTNHNEKTDYLNEVGSSYLYRDVLELSSIRNSSKIYDLLRLLALQIGSEVSLSELGSNIGLTKETVKSYINLLEKSFVIFTLPGFSRNLRKEISKMNKIYFYDLGIRNMIINQFQPLEFRNDIGALWENFLIMERIKSHSFNNNNVKMFFWRTYTQSELDLIEDNGTSLHAFEFKWKNKLSKCPLAWKNNYPDSIYNCITRENYSDFIA